MTAEPRNVPASIHARLLALAENREVEFNRILERYAFERLLYRLSISDERSGFVLKGALLFVAWPEVPERATRDVDFLGMGSPDPEDVASRIRTVCDTPVPEEDGLVFASASVKAETIGDHGSCGGVRVRLEAMLGRARIPVRIDVGFGDAIVPEPVKLHYPVLLDHPPPTLLTYSVESVIAEKLEAMVFHGLGNSRLKDYHDLWALAERARPDPSLLAEAVAATFRRRGTPLPTSNPGGLSEEYFADEDRRNQWQAFLSRSRIEAAPSDFTAVGESLRDFLLPVLERAKRARIEFQPTGAGQYRPYPAYRDSGVDWLGEVPEGWAVRRLKYGVGFTGGGTPSTEDLSFWQGEIPWVSPKDMGGDWITVTEDRLTEAGLGESPCRLVPVGSVLLVVRSGILRRTIPVGVNRVPVAVNQDMKALVPGPSLDPSYLRFVISGKRDYLLTLWRKQGATVESLEHDRIANTVLPLPPLPEQRAIAAFLDRETTKIDTLIAKKERLLDLLDEKRSALISQAVTKGLDPDVPMKDSGVEWLGEVPEGWAVTRLKWASEFREGPGIMAADFRDDGVPLLRIRNLQSRFVTLKGCGYLDPKMVDEKWDRFRVCVGDLLISGSASSGLVSEVGDNSEGAIPYTGIFIFRPRPDRQVHDWLRCFLESDGFLGQVQSMQTGVGISHFGPTHLSRVDIPLPPLPEQQAIAAYLDRETAKIDALKTKIQHAIALLKEYRTALISAAVTGKIDVRDEVAA